MNDPPRRENRVRRFTAQETAATLRRAAQVRLRLEPCADHLMLDHEGRPCDEEEATKASIQGCVRIAAKELKAHDRHDARDLRAQAAGALQDHLGHGLIAYDHGPGRDPGQAAQDLRECADRLEREEPGR